MVLYSICKSYYFCFAFVIVYYQLLISFHINKIVLFYKDARRHIFSEFSNLIITYKISKHEWVSQSILSTSQGNPFNRLPTFSPEKAFRHKTPQPHMFTDRIKRQTIPYTTKKERARVGLSNEIGLNGLACVCNFQFHPCLPKNAIHEWSTVSCAG